MSYWVYSFFQNFPLFKLFQSDKLKLFAQSSYVKYIFGISSLKDTCIFLYCNFLVANE